MVATAKLIDRLSVARRRQSLGITKLELVVVLAIIAILSGFFLVRLAAVEAQSERLMVDLTIRNIRAGLRQEQLLSLVKKANGPLEISALADRDPTDFLDQRPEGYTADANAALRAGSWHFDRGSGRLSYRPKSVDAFGGQQELRWRLMKVVEMDTTTVKLEEDGYYH